MRNLIRSLSGLTTAIFVASASAQPPPLLRNSVTPGLIQVYSIQMRLTPGLSGPDSSGVESRQTGELSIINLNRLGEGVVQRAWVLQLDDPVITRIGVPDPSKDDLPTPFQLGLPAQSVRFLLDAGRSSDAGMVTTGGQALYRTAFFLAADVGHWPTHDPQPRDTWSTPIRSDDFEGARACRMLKMSSAQRERTAVMDQDIAGQFLGQLPETHRLISGRVDLEWSVTEHSLMHSTAEITFESGNAQGKQSIKITVNVDRREHRLLSADQRTAAVDQLNDLHPAIALYNDHHDAEAMQKLEAFSAQYPSSLWSAVASDMLVRLKFERDVLGLPSEPDGLTRLGRLMEVWQVADLAGRSDELEAIREQFRRLATERYDEVVNLTEDNDPSIRAASHFCLAFADASGVDPLLISGTGDAHPRVRAWAMYGIAQRRDARLGARVFEQGLADADVAVRQRTCQAIRYSVDRTTEGRERWAASLLQLMAHDENADVRLFATRALRRFATPQHMSQLEAIEDAEAIPEVRSEMRDLVIQVGGVPQSARRNR